MSENVYINGSQGYGVLSMKRTLMIALLTILTLTGWAAEKVAEFDSVFRPDMISMSDKFIYITEKTSVHIFDAKTYQPIKTFGREGEGPKEFKINPFGTALIISCIEGKLVINSFAKVSLYTATGDYIQEFKVPPNQVYIPFGDSYIYTGIAKNKDDVPVIAINMADKDFTKKKELYVSDWKMGSELRFDFPITSFAFAPVAGKIYVVAGKEGFVIDVFDRSGAKLSRFQNPYTPIKLDADYERKTIHWFKTDPRWKNLYTMFKERISFKSHFPPIYNMLFDKYRLYVLTYKMKDNLRECIVFNLDLKEIKRVFLPIPEVYGLGVLPKYTFYGQAFYILTENEDEEIIELTKIELR